MPFPVSASDSHKCAAHVSVQPVEIALTELGTEVRATILKGAYLGADIEQNQLLPVYLDAGEFSFPQVVFSYHRVPRHRLPLPAPTSSCGG